MYCPQCRVEYRDGFFECSDCHVRLAAGLSPEPVEEPDNTPTGGRDLPAAALTGLPASLTELVTVLETDDSFALGLARSSLEDAGIGFVLSCDEHGHHPIFPSAFPMGVPPICSCWCRVQVAPEDENEARVLLEPLQDPEPTPDPDTQS